MKILLSLFLMLIHASVFAQASGSHLFSKFGSLEKISYRPISSPLAFEYDVFYYIPEKLKGKKDLKTLVFLHGGGASTSDRAGSLRVAKMYMDDLISYAEALGVVLIGPSGSGLNWGGHMLSYLKDLNQTIRQELPVDPDKIALTGHSMGGMGITRSAHWLADEYAFFMPVAAGMDERHATETNLRPYFNMSYHHLQGLNDHFQIFITRCQNQQKEILSLERKYNKKTGFNLEFYNGAHNYPRELYLRRLAELLRDKRRDFYQSELNGHFYYRDEVLDLPNEYAPFYLAPRNRYFWLEARQYEKELTLIKVDAKITGNLVSVQVDPGLKTLRVYLSEKLLNVKREVEIRVNGKILFKGLPDLSRDMSEQTRKDSGYQFDSYVDLNL